MKLRRDRLAFCLLAGLFVFLLQQGRAVADDKKASVSESEEEKQVPVGLEGVELEELESDYKPSYKRFVIPPYYQETSERLKLRTFFPFVFYRERTGEGAFRELGIFPVYWRHRSQKKTIDFVFPLYGRFRGPSFKTDIVLQTYYNRSDHGYNLGFAPWSDRL